MCHFVWYDNECSSCGFTFDRKLTKCKYVNARVPRPACDKTYLRENQPDFRCQNCTAPETPWRKVEFLVNANEADYHTDYPTDDDCRDGDYEGDDESASSEDDGDVESQRKIGNSKRKLEGSTWQGTRRSLKRACKERGIRRIGMLN
ncbi:ankyrin [Colletotrichum abscissum]